MSCTLSTLQLQYLQKRCNLGMRRLLFLKRARSVCNALKPCFLCCTASELSTMSAGLIWCTAVLSHSHTMTSLNGFIKSAEAECIDSEAKEGLQWIRYCTHLTWWVPSCMLDCGVSCDRCPIAVQRSSTHVKGVLSKAHLDRGSLCLTGASAHCCAPSCMQTLLLPPDICHMCICNCLRPLACVWHTGGAQGVEGLAVWQS